MDNNTTELKYNIMREKYIIIIKIYDYKCIVVSDCKPSATFGRYDLCL